MKGERASFSSSSFFTPPSFVPLGGKRLTDEISRQIQALVLHGFLIREKRLEKKEKKEKNEIKKTQALGRFEVMELGGRKTGEDDTATSVNPPYALKGRIAVRRALINISFE